ncbi:MAG: protein-export chaperone SecB [Gammaproteobacteria bacterium]|nr:protein-export chaperone SecB [Gammaproteobacteria bacterium]
MSEEQPPKSQFTIQKIYVKDVSFESPATPQAFQFKKWEPKIDLNLGNQHSSLGNDNYEVILSVTVKVNREDKTAFLIEVQQAGIFVIQGFSEQDRNYLLGSQCMSILMPYARELVSDMTTRGGFPPLILAPVNFDPLYQQHLEKKKTQVEGEQASKAEEVVKH